MTGQEESLCIKVRIYAVSLLADTKVIFRKKEPAAPVMKTYLPSATNMGSEPLKQQLSARSKKELKFCSPSSQVNTPTLTPRALDAIFTLAPPAATVTSLSHRNEEEITAAAYLTWNTEFSYCERRAVKHSRINSLVLLQGNPPYPNGWQVCSSLSALEYQGEVLGNKRGDSMHQSMTVATMLDSCKVSKPKMDKILKT